MIEPLRLLKFVRIGLCEIDLAGVGGGVIPFNCCWKRRGYPGNSVSIAV
jgi:hypothetical protein